MSYVVTNSKTNPSGILTGEQIGRFIHSKNIGFYGHSAREYIDSEMDATAIGIRLQPFSQIRGNKITYMSPFSMKNLPDGHFIYIDSTSSGARAGNNIRVFDENGNDVFKYPDFFDKGYESRPKGRIFIEMENPFYDIVNPGENAIANLRIIKRPDKALMNIKKEIQNPKAGKGRIALLGKDYEPIPITDYEIQDNMLVLNADTLTADEHGNSAYTILPAEMPYILAKNSNKLDNFLRGVRPDDSIIIDKKDMLLLYHEYKLHLQGDGAVMPYESPKQGIGVTNRANMIHANGVDHPQLMEIYPEYEIRINNGEPVAYLLFFKTSEEITHKRKTLKTNGWAPGKNIRRPEKKII